MFSDDYSLDTAIFQEPPGYFKAEAPGSYEEFTLLSGQALRLRLVGHNPLWGHHLWNGAKSISVYLQQHAESIVRHKNVLELGAGAGLPGLISAMLGAQNVVITDYPDADLIANLQHNIDSCNVQFGSSTKISTQGYLWGKPAHSLLSRLPLKPLELENQHLPGFDLLILADLLFNHSEHSALLDTIKSTLKRSQNSKALVFFTPYRPWLLDKDMAFFKLATEEGFVVHKVVEETMEKVMFEEDPGDELLRRTVFGFELSWPKNNTNCTREHIGAGTP